MSYPIVILRSFAGYVPGGVAPKGWDRHEWVLIRAINGSSVEWAVLRLRMVVRMHTRAGGAEPGRQPSEVGGFS